MTGALAALGGNLEDSTMTLLRGHFAMVVLVRVHVAAKAVRKALEPVSASGRLTVDVRKLAADTVPSAPGRAWTLRVHGADRPGIVAEVTRSLLGHSLNITDSQMAVLGGRFSMMLIVEAPEGTDLDAVREELARTRSRLDLDAEGLTKARRLAAVTALREVGFAAWLRTPAQGDWPLHIHAIAISDTDLSAPAQNQVGDYYEGRNGLANDLPDDGPQVPKVTYEEFLRSS